MKLALWTRQIEYLACFLAGFALLSACKPQTTKSNHDSQRIQREELVLPPSIIVAGEQYVPIPLAVRSGSSSSWIPATLEQAADELVAMLPPDVAGNTAVDIDRSVCQVSDIGDAENYDLCKKELCKLLPEESRDPPCSFFFLLSQWTKENWLGGGCGSASWTAKTPVANWLSTRNIVSCTVMAEIIQRSLLLRLARMDFDPEDLTRKYAILFSEQEEPSPSSSK